MLHGGEYSVKWETAFVEWGMNSTGTLAGDCSALCPEPSNPDSPHTSLVHYAIIPLPVHEVSGCTWVLCINLLQKCLQFLNIDFVSYWFAKFTITSIVFYGVYRIFCVHYHVICKQWHFCFLLSNLDAFYFFFLSDCCVYDFEYYVE